ncbi:hypothetical protein C5C41_03200 [Rathayibacter sp. AY1E9]|uniref:hypothetical protein n=1 Tax=Rathayibacter sp. AY1E9 TaxID=2080556 RepID=UPI000CE89069|nr:hypothetical protein [Rathayibacter sp. AY1E9]PPG54499.1 hypothetical protein C5C41_03200 [Rathayibacter sp. AY1E9]
MSSTDLGAFTRRAALRAGMTDARLRTPALASPFHGVRTRVAPVTHLERAAAYLPRLRRWQLFSHLTAAEAWGVPLPARPGEDDPIHVAATTPHRPPRTRGVIGHTLTETDRVERHGLPVTGAVSTWIALAPLLSARDLLAATDHLLFEPRYPRRDDPRPHVRLHELQDRLASHRGRGRRGLAEALRLASTGAASRRETWLRALVEEAGLPAPDVNAEIRIGGRLLAVGDLVFERWKVVAEYDGGQHRTDDAQFSRDRERLLALHLADWIVVVVRAEGLTRGRARTIAELRAALVAHGWRP